MAEATKRPYIDHDRLFKEVLSEFFLDFLDLFFPNVAAYVDRSSLVALDKEIFTDVTAGETHEVDVLFRAKFKASERVFLLHIESQSYKQDNFDFRMFQYFSRLYLKYQIKVKSFAIFSYNSPYIPEPSQHIMEFPDGERDLDYHFKVVQLNLLDWRTYLNYPNPVASAFMAKMKIEEKDRVKVKLACLKMLTGLKLNPAQKRLLTGFIDIYLKLTQPESQAFAVELAKEPPPKQEKIMELTTSWKEEGILIGRAEGKIEGITEGKIEGKRQMVLEQINFRFGKIKPSAEKQISGLGEPKIEELAKAIFGFTNQADLTAWLKQNAK
jgi:Domain of unknown function (DUF4351)/Putative transposase, YhgA-like